MIVFWQKKPNYIAHNRNNLHYNVPGEIHTYVKIIHFLNWHFVL